jgi:hypothetical protein
MIRYGTVADTNHVPDGWPKLLWEMYLCPVCKAYCVKLEEQHVRDGMLPFTCGGLYRRTVDVNGDSCWEGGCPTFTPVQKEFQFDTA